MYKTINKPLKTLVTHEGQAYVDEPVYEVVSAASPIALAVTRSLPFEIAGKLPYVFGMPPDESIRDAEDIAPLISPRQQLRTKITALSRYNHVRLRWMKPDGEGGLVPAKRRLN